MNGQWNRITVIAMVLLFLAVGCGPNAAPAAPPTQPPPALPPTATAIPLTQIVTAAMQGWDRESIDASQIDTTLAYFADEATFKIIGFPPEIPADFSGKAAIRKAFESWMPGHPRLQVKIEKTEGDQVIATTSYSSDPTRGMGVAPLVGMDVYLIKNGKIVQETWTLTDESRQAFAAAMARAAAPTPKPTVATTAQGFPVGSFRIVPSLVWIDFHADGTLYVPAVGDRGAINGKVTVTGDQVTWEDDYCSSPGIYKWKFDGTTLSLQLVSDNCDPRNTVQTYVVR